VTAGTVRLALAVFLTLLAGGQAVAAEPQIPAEAKAREARLLAKASPAVKTWVREEAQRVRKAGDVNESAVQASVRARFGSVGGVGDGDIMAIAFLVMMEAAKSAREDLKSIMAETKRLNEAKAQQRAVLDKQKDQRDSLSEQGKEQQLKMQQVMDRMTKADSAASNTLKKFQETASSIIGNMK
jgi:hypothetical protein